MGLDPNLVTRLTGVSVTYQEFRSGAGRLLPQQVAIIGQGNTASTYDLVPTRLTSALQAAQKYGFGSPIHLAAKQLLPLSGDGLGSVGCWVYPLEDAGTGVTAAGAIAASGTQTGTGLLTVYINNQAAATVSAADGDTAAQILAKTKTAIDSVLDMPVLTGTIAVDSLPVTAKWAGASGNDVKITIEADDDIDFTFTITQLTGGANNPDVDDALALIGSRWITMIVNCMELADTTTLDKYEAYGIGRWNAMVKKPLVVITGANSAYATYSAISDARKADRINAVIPVIASKNLPFEIAARAVSRIAVTANNLPANNYKEYLDGIDVGDETLALTDIERDISVKAGASTTITENGKVKLNDTVTFYHPEGNPLPEYRYICDIVKLMNIVYNIDIIFISPEWTGVPLVSDDTIVTRNRTAKKPKDARVTLGNLADSLASYALISDPEFTRENLVVAIDNTNPKRLNMDFPVKLSGNVEIKDVNVYFGFEFGE